MKTKTPKQKYKRGERLEKSGTRKVGRAKSKLTRSSKMASKSVSKSRKKGEIKTSTPRLKRARDLEAKGVALGMKGTEQKARGQRVKKASGYKGKKK